MKSVIWIGIIIMVFAQSSFALKWVMCGDSRDDMTDFGKVISGAALENPALILHDGDCWGSVSPAAWLNVIKANTVTNALLNANNFLVSRGNHDDWATLKAVTPSVVRNNSETYSFSMGNCFFVSQGFDPAQNYANLRAELSSSAAQAAKWRFIFQHKPIYSTGSHGADGTTSEGSAITLYRNYCDTFKVTMCFSGHDHIYERTKLVYKGAAVGSGTTYKLGVTPGTVYCVQGQGGAPSYSVGSQWWDAYSQGGAHFSWTVIDARDDTCFVTTKDISGNTVKDQFMIIHEPATAVAQTNATKNYPKAWGVSALGENRFMLTSAIGATYRILDPNGRIVVQGKIVAGKQRLDFNGFTRGVHIVYVNLAGRILQQKITVM